MNTATDPLSALVESAVQRAMERLQTRMPVSRRLFSLEDAADYLGLSTAALKQKAACGKIPIVRIDRYYRFDREDLDKLINSCKMED